MSKSKRSAGKKSTGKGVIIAPSILSADFGRLGAEVKAVDKAGADWIHVDVMDGRFVPNITIGPMVVKAVRKATDLPLDVHLMIVEPEKYIDEFVAAGADIITVHAEACSHLHRVIQQIKEAGKKLKPKKEVMAGVSLNPATSLAAIEYILPELDMVLLMSVNPGFGGQEFIPASIDKIQDLSWLADDMGLENLLIQVDGGINLDNIGPATQAGAKAFVAGNTVFSAQDYKKIIRELKDRAKAAPEE